VEIENRWRTLSSTLRRKATCWRRQRKDTPVVEKHIGKWLRKLVMREKISTLAESLLAANARA
jgi:hypothetical protein